MLAELNPSFPFLDRSRVPAFEEFDLDSRFVELDHRMENKHMIGEFLVSVRVGEEEELNLLDTAEY